MTATIDAYYDFRSPYAYFANHRIRQGSFALPLPATWLWRPVSIDILLNLGAGRDAWASYVDPLSGPKRAHLVADVRRTARVLRRAAADAETTAAKFDPGALHGGLARSGRPRRLSECGIFGNDRLEMLQWRLGA